MEVEHCILRLSKKQTDINIEEILSMARKKDLELKKGKIQIILVCGKMI